MLKIDRSSDVRTDELSTIAEVAKTFVSFGSPRVVIFFSAVFAALRLAVGGFGWFDLVLVVITAVLVGPVEWVIHLGLLHAPEDSKRMTKYDTGGGHREHHLDPQNVGWALLSWQDVSIFVFLLAGWSAVWALPLTWVVGAPLLGSFLTAQLLAVLGLLHYEWTHLLVHTRYRPKTRYYKRLARNHRLHHYRSEYHWLGVTSNLGDRVLGTLPKNKSDVPLSETARTLGG